MKKILIYLLMAILVLSFVGCGVQEKIGEEIAEGIIEGEGDVDVDINGDKITIEGEDGEKLVIGGTEWPKADLAKEVPKFEKGDVISVMETEESVSIVLENVKKDDFMNYLETIKSDFSEEAYEINAEGTVSYGAQNGQGIGVNIYYTEESVGITVVKNIN